MLSIALSLFGLSNYHHFGHDGTALNLVVSNLPFAHGQNGGNWSTRGERKLSIAYMNVEFNVEFKKMLSIALSLLWLNNYHHFSHGGSALNLVVNNLPFDVGKNGGNWSTRGVTKLSIASNEKN